MTGTAHQHHKTVATDTATKNTSPSESKGYRYSTAAEQNKGYRYTTYSNCEEEQAQHIFSCRNKVIGTYSTSTAKNMGYRYSKYSAVITGYRGDRTSQLQCRR